MVRNIAVLIIFTGSVFITSGKFVNSTNTPKFYFAEVLLVVSIIILAISKRGFKTGSFTNYKTLLWGIYTVLVAQAFYGLCQFAGWLPSHNSNFAVTGSFDNPAGFAALLSIGFPIGLYMFIKSENIKRYLVVAGLIVITTSVFLSGSRTGMLALVISSLVFFMPQSNITAKIKQFRFYKLLLVLSALILIASASLLYQQKKDSANGRLLIWQVSGKMIKDKPLLGHGYGAFKAKYMDYQANYFKNSSESKYKPLADNVKHPFNEFVKIAVEFGIVGLVVTLLIILFVLWKMLKSKSENRPLVLSGLTSFLIFACFSYPLQYVAVWILLAFYLTTILKTKEIKIRKTPVTLIGRVVIVIACMFLLLNTYKQIYSEIKWKEIAMNSLHGKTEAMLPKYEKLYPALKHNPFFLYNYGAELNVAGEFDKSISILNECKKHFNDYDLQMLLADNYSQKGEISKAIKVYKYASYMIPCRFMPLYNIANLYKKTDNRKELIKTANAIIKKPVKIPSYTVTAIKNEMREILIKTSKK